MKKYIILPLIAAVGLLTSCDETTDAVGFSLTEPTDRLDVDYGTFNVSSETVKLENIVSRSTIGYLGKMKDPETGSYITCNYTTQFRTMENGDHLAKSDFAQDNGQIIADSCEVRIYYYTSSGDNNIPMKCKLQEMAKPLSETETYTTDFKPTAENGYLRSNGISQSTTYSLKDNSIPEDTESARCIRIQLNNEYTDTKGNKYNNYGSYILNKCYEGDGSNINNSYKFVHNVCPGFFIESTGGIGCMANISITQLRIHAKCKQENGTMRDSLIYFNGTEEVVQRTNISQDNDKLTEMANEGDYTYLKTPAGLCTQITLPVDEVYKGHENDTLNTARMILLRESNEKEVNNNTFGIPTTLLILPADRAEAFFAKNEIADNRDSYIATYIGETKDNTGNVTERLNGYRFSNISGILRLMKKAKDEYIAAHPGTTDEQYETLFPKWNKALIVPVITSKTTVTSSYTSTEVLSRVTHDMSLTSTKLVGGKNNPNAIKINCIYSKFKNK